MVITEQRAHPTLPFSEHQFSDPVPPGPFVCSPVSESGSPPTGAELHRGARASVGCRPPDLLTHISWSPRRLNTAPDSWVAIRAGTGPSRPLSGGALSNDRSTGRTGVSAADRLTPTTRAVQRRGRSDQNTSSLTTSTWVSTFQNDWGVPSSIIGVPGAVAHPENPPILIFSPRIVVTLLWK